MEPMITDVSVSQVSQILFVLQVIMIIWRVYTDHIGTPAIVYFLWHDVVDCLIFLPVNTS